MSETIRGFTSQDLIIVTTINSGQERDDVCYYAGMDGHLLYTYDIEHVNKVYNTMSLFFKYFRHPTPQELKIVERGVSRQ